MRERIADDAGREIGLVTDNEGDRGFTWQCAFCLVQGERGRLADAIDDLDVHAHAYHRRGRLTTVQLHGDIDELDRLRQVLLGSLDIEVAQFGVQVSAQLMSGYAERIKISQRARATMGGNPHVRQH